jgi:hypothetical protein
MLGSQKRGVEHHTLVFCVGASGTVDGRPRWQRVNRSRRPSDAVPLHGAVLKRLTRNERPLADLLRGPYAFVGGHCTKGAKIHHVEDRSKADQTLLNCRLKNHFRHRRQVRELFRNLAPLGLNSLIISSAKLCMIANQVDLRAAFFIFLNVVTFQ